MSYQGEDLIGRLKQARIIAGLSQRALAQRSGLTQSHISQIENGATEPGLSSLIDLTRALDLEVMLVPRKRIPAVSSLIADWPQAAPTQLDPGLKRELDQGDRLIAAIAGRMGNNAALDRLREVLTFLRSVPMGPQDRATLVEAIASLKRNQDRPEITRRTREASETLWSMRNRLTHARPTRVKAAYALDDEDLEDD